MLWEAALEYFQWVEDNPLSEEKLFAFRGHVTRDKISKMRAMTIGGISIFLDIDVKTWKNYRDNDDFFPIINRIETIIRDQKLTGAAADLFNANIIAREIGLKDTTAHELSGPDGKPLATINREMTAEEAASIYAQEVLGGE